MQLLNDTTTINNKRNGLRIFDNFEVANRFRLLSEALAVFTLTNRTTAT
jgi:hypothetical protein